MSCCSRPVRYTPPDVCLNCGSVLETTNADKLIDRTLRVLYFVLGGGVAALALILLMLSKVFFGW